MTVMTIELAASTIKVLIMVLAVGLAVELGVVLTEILALALVAALVMPLPAMLICGADRDAGRDAGCHADHVTTVDVPRQSAAATDPRAVLLKSQYGRYSERGCAAPDPSTLS